MTLFQHSSKGITHRILSPLYYISFTNMPSYLRSPALGLPASLFEVSSWPDLPGILLSTLQNPDMKLYS